jgi:preprotein translocase subunit SecD
MRQPSSSTGEVISVAVVQEPITGGRARMSLGPLDNHADLVREAIALAGPLRAGALPSPTRLTHEQVIKPFAVVTWTT